MTQILLIEDEVQLQSLYQRFLKEAGFQVISTNSGKSAFEILAQIHVDLLITDILMPEMDGIEIICHLRTMNNPPPVIAISGGGIYLQKRNLLEMAKEFGVQHTLCKPFTQDELLETVKKALGNSQVIQ
ncbi:MAG: response regulator [Magnetococcales bacterium]|nr:response regulator [Magnetococcales bacterium]NGZ27253.1 response regulator [Magnetococcales bacterium]